MGKTVSFHTLGCKLNYSESSALARQFAANGYTVVSQNKPADIYVINTCTVTEHSDKKSRNIIRKLHRKSPGAIIAVIGCYAQLKGDEIAKIEGVDVILGAQKKGLLLQEVQKIESERNFGNAKMILDVEDIEKVSSVYSAFSSGERTRSFLKVQDGCDYKCSYCTIPKARGKSRNLSIAELVEQAHQIASLGIKEIVLTGVNIGDFGRTTGESFLELLKQLNEVEGIERYRISSIEPNLLTREIVEWIASGTKFLPHFHIPLQSGCDEILRRMRRRYNTAMFAEKIELVREYMGNPFFGIDVITGFPGETEELFMETYNFLERVRPAFIHIFPYSRRKDTPAAEMPDQVDEQIKQERVHRLEALCDKLHKEYYESFKGATEEVLFESTQKNGKMFGYTRNYILVERPYDKELIGKISTVVLD
ncbi:MAG: tRNA (N(6)-L-threonylcarbamoyladenosine(37)-C(2))-methylthiotransferase MtaB [Bacteroidales bacterium]|jgi:threonylcarbamoyladenosine tRNA methylthiotransferase MtaB|nr:tRNA (N(6)-L-threonylcarbamoyladenosine(37)-C(2))-methylthiotransferase MtaB [Bacteroidales bacterium]